MKAEEFDKKFDAAQSIIDDLDLSKARRPEQEQKRVNVDFPVWMIQSLDKEARRIGVAYSGETVPLIPEQSVPPSERSDAGGFVLS